MARFYPSKWAAMKLRADALALILPATTREDIADRLGAILGRTFAIYEIAHLLTWVKRHQIALGWTVSYGQKGENPLLKDRFIMIPLDHDSSWHTAAKDAVCREGEISHSASEATRLSRQAQQLLAEATQAPNHREKLIKQSRALDYEYLAKKEANANEDAREDLKAARP